MEDEVLQLFNAPPKLTKWQKEPKLADLQSEFIQAKASHDKHMMKIKTWLDNLNVEGEAAVKNKSKNRSSIVPRLIRKSAEWRIPSLTEPFLSTNKLFQVDPATWADKEAAEQNALVLNYQFQTKIDKVHFFDQCIRAVVEQGTAIVRVGWDFEEREVMVDEPQFQFSPVDDEQTMQDLQQYAMEYQSNPMVFKNTRPDEMIASVEASLQYGQPVMAQLTGYRKVRKKQTVKNHPTLEVCDLNNVYIDPTCNGDLDKAQFIIYSYEVPYAELKRDPRYKNLEYLQAAQTTYGSDPYHSYTEDARTMSYSDKAKAKLVVYEYWGYYDIDDTGTLRPILVAWADGIIIRMEENPFPDGKPPFVAMTYLAKRQSIYGEPDAELLLENQAIQGAIMRGMIDSMGRSANGQMGIMKGMLDASNRIKFERGDDYEFNPNTHPNMGVIMHQFPEVPQSAQFLVQMMNMEAESLTGVKAYSGTGGITGAALGDTAIGVRSAMDAASKREMSILRRISSAVIKIGRKIIAMNAVFLDEEEIVRITDEEFIAVKRDDLAGNFDLKLTISTAEGDEAKAQQIAFMMQTIGNNMDPQMRNQMLAEIFRLRKMPEFAKQIENFQPQPDPMQQQMAQLEMQRLQAEIQLLNAQAQEAMTKGGLNQAKVPVEQARANNLQSDADKKSLDFVEQHDGIQHNRELELEEMRNREKAFTQQAQQQHEQEMQRLKHAQDSQRMFEQSNLDSQNNVVSEALKAYLNPQQRSSP